MIDSLLLTTVRIVTFDDAHALTNATGFFFERDERLFLVTSRHVVVDEPSQHFPDRLEIELHTDQANLAKSAQFSMPLYRDRTSVWRQGRDEGGDVDIAVIEVERATLPETVVYRAFTPDHLHSPPDRVQVGTALLVVGFPLGFQDTLHHMPVVRHAVLASSFGLRFQGQGYGRRALELLIAHVRTRPGATELLTSCVPGDGSPCPFYERMGFVYTGEEDDGELVMRLIL